MSQYELFIVGLVYSRHVQNRPKGGKSEHYVAARFTYNPVLADVLPTRVGVSPLKMIVTLSRFSIFQFFFHGHTLG